MFVMSLLSIYSFSFLYINFVEEILVFLLQLSDSIVVVKRGDCTYATKARIAESSGAAGLLVINDDEGKFDCFVFPIFKYMYDKKLL